MKKLRLLYWRLRDAGKKNQVIVFGVLSLVVAFSIFGMLLYGVIQREKFRGSGENSTQQEINAQAVSENIMQTERMEKRASMGTEAKSVFGFPVETEVDDINTDGLNSYSAFMPDSVFQTLKDKVVELCKKRGADSPRKLNYQNANEGTYDVTSYILLSDGTVCKCVYNLRSNIMTVSETTYQETDISAMEAAQAKEEAEKLKAQQEADRQEAVQKTKEKGKKNGKQKAKGKKKKVSSKKTVKKTKTKSKQ